MLVSLPQANVLGAPFSASSRQDFGASVEDSYQKPLPSGLEERSANVVRSLGGTAKLIRHMSQNMSSEVRDRQKKVSLNGDKEARELAAVREELAVLKGDKEALQMQAKQSETQLTELKRLKEEAEAKLEHLRREDTEKHTLDEQMRLLTEQQQQNGVDIGRLHKLLDPVVAPETGHNSPLQQIEAQLQTLLARNTELTATNMRLSKTPPKVPKGKEKERIAELEKNLADSYSANEQLQKDLELMKRENGEEASNMAVALAVAKKETEIVQLQHQLGEFENQAQMELEEMHEELLEMRKACHDLEIALNESEAKRDKMLLEKQQLEQQLQEAAGELVEAERELQSRGGSSPRRKAHSLSISNEDPELGPETPPASHPSRASLPATQKAGHIVLPVGELQAFDSLRREFDAMMQELVQKKLELAEMHEDYERVCHAFLKADEAKNGPILCKLRRGNSLMRVSIHAEAQ